MNSYKMSLQESSLRLSSRHGGQCGFIDLYNMKNTITCIGIPISKFQPILDITSYTSSAIRPRLFAISNRYCNNPGWDRTGDVKHGTNRLAQSLSQPVSNQLHGHLRVPSQCHYRDYNLSLLHRMCTLGIECNH